MQQPRLQQLDKVRIQQRATQGTRLVAAALAGQLLTMHPAGGEHVTPRELGNHVRNLAARQAIAGRRVCVLVAQLVPDALTCVSS